MNTKLNFLKNNWTWTKSWWTQR